MVGVADSGERRTGLQQGFEKAGILWLTSHPKELGPDSSLPRPVLEPQSTAGVGTRAPLCEDHDQPLADHGTFLRPFNNPELQ